MRSNSLKPPKHPLFRAVCIALILVLCAGTTFSQSTTDTVSLAKKIRNEGKIKTAFQLLDHYTQQHPHDFNALWLTAQTAYWANKIQFSRSLYERLISENPANYYLKLDYAKMLVEIGSFNEALSLLNTYLAYEPSNTQALIALTKINYWQGDYKTAYAKINDLIKKHPGENNAIALKNEILLAMSPWLSVNATYDNDDQPFQTFTPSLEGGLYFNPLADLHFSLASSFFTRNGSTDNSISFQLYNRSNFYKQDITTEISAGIVKFPFQNTIRATGSAGIKKTFLKNLFIDIHAVRKPYFYSLKSIDTLLTEDNITVSSGWNNQHNINGNIGFSSGRFSDKNTISSFYATIYAPTLKIKDLAFRVGYSYNYSDSKQNNFVPAKTVSDITADPSAAITGIYDPYFTPNVQQVHSLIASINYQPQKKLSIGVSGNYGISASTRNPYFTVLKQGTVITGVGKDYTVEKFSPLQVGAYLLFQPTVKTSLKISYQYQHTFFYTNHNITLSFKTSFWNEKK